MIAEKKVCQSCSRNMQGRSDKKFCSDSCRNTHHNILNSPCNNFIRTVNHSLLKNRRILADQFTSSRQLVKTSKHNLQEQQFDFHVFTHQHTNRKGERYLFCYEFGYRLVKSEVTVVRKKIA